MAKPKMARLLDKILVIDLEATCWDDGNPEKMHSEIIEVGICLLDPKTGEISENRGILVKPEKSTISPFCTELTTITPEMIDLQGVSYQEACEILKKDYRSGDRPWASFGAYDAKQFLKQSTSSGIRYPLSPSHINIKTFLALKLKLQKEVGMAGALKLLKIPLTGTHHRGVDDANNIAKILKYCLK